MMTIHLAGDGYQAYLVVDSTVHNTSCGGVRIAENVTLAEVKALAREMTLKYAIFRLPRGGAKTGICISPNVSADEKTGILREIGRKLAPIIRTGVYNPGMDLNCGPEELRAIYAGAGLQIGKVTDTSYFTALSVESAVYTCCKALDTPGKLTVAIDGFGRVAGHLAARLPPEKYRIVAISTLRGAVRNRKGFDSRLLFDKRNEVGDDLVRGLEGEKINRVEVITEPVDILIPSSRTWVITTTLADQVEARMVVPIANAPYEDGAISRLHKKGILCLPGFVTNAGGVFGSSLYDSGVKAGEVETILEAHYQPFVTELLSRSKTLGLPPTEVAELLAVKELRARNRRAASSGIGARVLKRLRHRLPRSVRAWMAQRMFVQSMRSIIGDLQNLAP